MEASCRAGSLDFAAAATAASRPRATDFAHHVQKRHLRLDGGRLDGGGKFVRTCLTIGHPDAGFQDRFLGDIAPDGGLHDLINQNTQIRQVDDAPECRNGGGADGITGMVHERLEFRHGSDPAIPDRPHEPPAGH